MISTGTGLTVLPKDDHSSIVPLANALVRVGESFGLLRGVGVRWGWAFENRRGDCKTIGLEFG